MKYVNPNSIIEFFNELNAEGLKYILIRNLNNELPSNLKVGKDIDLLTPYNQRSKFINFLSDKGFKKLKHPLRHNIFLYGVNKFDFFVNRDKVLLDLNYQLTCQSLNAGEWIPLDLIIQESAWKNKKLITAGSFLYYSLGVEDEYVSLVVRSIFDKKEFQKGYIDLIDDLINIIDINDVIAKFRLIFYKFAPILLSMLKTRQYDRIFDQYLSFADY